MKPKKPILGSERRRRAEAAARRRAARARYFDAPRLVADLDVQRRGLAAIEQTVNPYRPGTLGPVDLFAPPGAEVSR